MSAASRPGRPTADPKPPPAPAAALLAIDCSGAACSVALAEAGEVRAARSVRLERGHAEILMPMVAETLAEAGADYHGIGCLAATVGPGSFTGIRTGLAAARGLALALSRPLVGVTTLEAAARAARRTADAAADCLVVLDSRRADLYVQRFAPDGSPRGEPAAVLPEALAASLGAGPLILAGDAADAVAPLLAARGAAFAGPAGDGAAGPAAVAAAVAEIAAERWRSMPAAGLPPPRPLYLRAPDAVKPAHGGRLRP